MITPSKLKIHLLNKGFTTYGENRPLYYYKSLIAIEIRDSTVCIYLDSEDFQVEIPITEFINIEPLLKQYIVAKELLINYAQS